jgi:hypothetical protein
MHRIQSIYDDSFKKYGAVVTGLSSDAIRAAAARIPMPEAGVSYRRSIPELENTADFQGFLARYGGFKPIQAGLCWGYNTRMDCMEYHRASEVDIAVTDCVVMLGDRRDIDTGEVCAYDSGLVELFRVPAGATVELYATTLHYAPCQTDGAGFRMIILLPDGTNADLPSGALDEALKSSGEHRLLWGVDKWLIAHPDTAEAKAGALAGIRGENLDIAGG